MQQIATITSKRQLTIPSEMFQKLGLKEGQKVLLSEEKGAIKITSMLNLIEELAGSVSIPKRFRGLPIEKIKKQAIEEYFNNRHDLR